MVCSMCASLLNAGLTVETVGPSVKRAERITGGCEICRLPIETGAAARVIGKIAELGRFGLTGQRLLARRSA